MWSICSSSVHKFRIGAATGFSSLRSRSSPGRKIAKTSSAWTITGSRSLSYKVAIVGSGPSGCYTAKYLQSFWEKKGVTNNQIDILDRLPTPYGLVRYGVAPDHPEVKNVQNDFATLFDSKGVDFWGNVQVGRDVSVQELRELYDVVVLAYGCESDRKLGLPGEDSLSGILSAREFVAWYNGHPDFLHIGEQVSKALRVDDKDDGVRQSEVVVIGQGNVALDCARILAKGKSGLFDTDIARRALPVLGDGVSHVSVVGRRGHVQGAFTIKELRELTKLKEQGFGASFVVREEELEMGTTAASLEELAGPGGRPKGRMDKLLRSAAANDGSDDASSKEVHLRFLLNPMRYEPQEDDPTSLGSVVCERTFLEGKPDEQKAVGTGTYETLAAQLVLVSIGYKGVPLPGMGQYFDEGRGIVVNEHGRIEVASSLLGGLYTSGWLKRGPSGIIGTNIGDAKDTVASIVHDLESSESEFESRHPSGDIQSLLKERSVDVVRWDGYMRIEDEERRRRRSESQPREKITDINVMLQTANNTK